MGVGTKIKNYLNDYGITQKFISGKTGIAMPKLNLALNEKRRFTFEEYELICGALRVGTDKFLEPKQPKRNAIIIQSDKAS